VTAIAYRYNPVVVAQQIATLVTSLADRARAAGETTIKVEP